MTAPVAAFVQLPSDAGNTGKKVRTQTRVVGADTVHEHFFIQQSQKSKVGVYSIHSGNLTIQAAAHNGTTTGFLWLINPVGNANKIAPRRMGINTQLVTSLALATVPRLLLSGITFTGTASGATLTPHKHDSTFAAFSGSMRTASTGLTVTLGNPIRAALTVTAAGTAGWTFGPPSEETWDFGQDEDNEIILRAGEGLVFWQADAGTTSDTRKAVCDTQAEEFE